MYVLNLGVKGLRHPKLTTSLKQNAALYSLPGPSVVGPAVDPVLYGVRDSVVFHVLLDGVHSVQGRTTRSEPYLVTTELVQSSLPNWSALCGQILTSLPSVSVRSYCRHSRRTVFATVEVTSVGQRSQVLTSLSSDSFRH